MNQRDVAVVICNGLGTFELGIVVELFGLPRPELAEWYRFKVCGAEDGALRATGGLHITPHEGLAGLATAGTIILPGWRSAAERPPQPLLDAVVAAHARGARLVSICSGVFIIAATGLLDGRRATTHWRYAEELKQKYPRIVVQPDVLYVDDGDILTSAGSAAGLDLCLHIVRRDFGARVANKVARRLVMPPHREGGQAQFIERAVGEEDRPWLAALLEWTERHLDEELPVERLAAKARISARTLSRRFVETTGTTPADWVIGLRVARARDLLETTARSVDEIAAACGFGSAPTPRHHFRARLKTTPTRYRAEFSG